MQGGRRGDTVVCGVWTVTMGVAGPELSEDAESFPPTFPFTDSWAIGIHGVASWLVYYGSLTTFDEFDIDISDVSLISLAVRKSWVHLTYIFASFYCP